MYAILSAPAPLILEGCAGVEANLLEGCIFDIGMINQPGFAQAVLDALYRHQDADFGLNNPPNFSPTEAIAPCSTFGTPDFGRTAS